MNLKGLGGNNNLLGANLPNVMNNMQPVSLQMKNNLPFLKPRKTHLKRIGEQITTYSLRNLNGANS
jgi:hypothetical protein